MSYVLLLGSRRMLETAGCLPKIQFLVFLGTDVAHHHFSLVWPRCPK